MPVMSGAKFDTYEPGALNCGRVVRAVTAEHLRLLALLDQLLGERLRVARLLRREEDDVGVARHLRHVRRVVGRRVRSREAGRRRRRPSSAPPRPRRRDRVEYGSWKSMITTFFTCSVLDHVVRVRRALDVVARDDAEERRRRLLRSSPASATVRVADGEMCAMLRLEVRRARRRDGAGRGRAEDARATLLSRDVLLGERLCRGRRPARRACRRARASSSAPSGFASVLTAYFAQLDCSAPRKPAPPVTGVTNGSLIVLAAAVTGRRRRPRPSGCPARSRPPPRWRGPRGRGRSPSSSSLLLAWGQRAGLSGGSAR